MLSHSKEWLFFILKVRILFFKDLRRKFYFLYETLHYVWGQKRMFDSGESYLFKVNAWGVGSTNSKIELIKLLSITRKASLAMGYAFGILN